MSYIFSVKRLEMFCKALYKYGFIIIIIIIIKAFVRVMVVNGADSSTYM